MTIIKTKDEQAEYLARRHKEIEPAICEVYQLLSAEHEADAEEPVKLLEIDASTIPVGVQPIYFTPDPENGLPFSTVIVAIAPEETEQLELPHNWIRGRKLA